MAVTFSDLIGQNKRNSIILVWTVSFFVIFFGGLIGYLIGVEGGADPLISAIFAMAAAVVLTIFLLLFSYYGGAGTILSISGARELDRQDDPQLYNVVEEMAIASGLPMPKVYLIDDTAPNAFATGRNPQHAVVAITRGLREKLTRDELQGVIAHEMSHIRNYDILFSMLMAVLVGVIALLADFFRRYAWSSMGSRGSRRSNSKSSGNSGAIVLVIFLIALILSIVAPLIAKLIELAVSRQREYLADAAGVELTRNPDGLASALAKISADPEVLEAANRATQHLYIVNPIKPFEERAAYLFSTHPPVKERIQRILSLKR